MKPWHLIRLFVLGLTVVATLMFAQPVMAWKPYTHSYTGFEIENDLLIDDYVTIDGHSYRVAAKIASAIRKYPDYFNGGVIGPDGFPDIAYGQSVIHPIHTGAWLRYLYNAAWKAQENPRYSADEKEQILAWSYGFLTHCAGDVWGHTLANDFAQGVFPSYSEIPGDLSKALIVARHIIAESYIIYATPGYDATPRYDAIPGFGYNNTREIRLNVPARFVYDTFIDPNAPTPKGPGLTGSDRGFLVDMFVKLRGGLQVTSSALWDNVSQWWLWIVCPVCQGIQIGLASYVDAWIDDIDTGLEHWPEFGLAVAKGMADPETHRRAESDKCTGATGWMSGKCEASQMDDIMYAIDHVYGDGPNGSFINRYLLSMLGFPDAVGVALGLRDYVMDLANDAFASLGIPSPFKAMAEIKEYIWSLLNEWITDLIGINFWALAEFSKAPSLWTCGTDGPGVFLRLFDVDVVPTMLFTLDQHRQLDEIMGLPVDHHVGGAPGLPEHCTPLKPSIKVDPEKFAPLKNSITLAKLLLLDGDELNRALGEVLTAQGWITSPRLVKTYDGAVRNVMLDPLPNPPLDPQTDLDSPLAYWLDLIDGDHAWRQDGLPQFCHPGDSTCKRPTGAAAQPPYLRVEDPNVTGRFLDGGIGNFPLWESCLLRPAFRALFKDWENGKQQFPDLGDYPAPDRSVPNAPNTVLSVSGVQYSASGITWVSGNFRLLAQDDVFAVDKLNVQYWAYRGGSAPSGPITYPNGSSFTVQALNQDGFWHIDYRGENPCHTFAIEPNAAGVDQLLPEQTRTLTYYIDGTPPVVTNTQPRVLDYVHSSRLTLDYAISDGQGSGVQKYTPTMDGSEILAYHGLESGQEIKLLFEMTIGPHTFAVNAVDNVGNVSTGAVTFNVIATPESIIDAVHQFRDNRTIRTEGMRSSLLGKLYEATSARISRDCVTANRKYQLVAEELQWADEDVITKAGAGILIGDARYLIAHCP